MRRFIRDKRNRLPIKIFFGFLIFDVLLLLFFVFSLPPEIPLFYSRPWGESQLAAPGLIWLLPTAVFLIGLLNLYLAVIFFAELPFLSHVLNWSNVLMSFLATVSIAKIITLVF